MFIAVYFTVRLIKNSLFDQITVELEMTRNTGRSQDFGDAGLKDIVTMPLHEGICAEKNIKKLSQAKNVKTALLP